MRLTCYFCGKSVSTEVPNETVVRALLCCPECLEKKKIKIPEPRPQYGHTEAARIAEKLRKGET